MITAVVSILIRLARSRLWREQEEEVLDEGRLLKPAEEGAGEKVREENSA